MRLLREANDVVFLGVLGDRGEELRQHRELRGRAVELDIDDACGRRWWRVYRGRRRHMWGGVGGVKREWRG